MEQHSYGTRDKRAEGVTGTADALLAATAEVAGEKVEQARKRLATAMDAAKEVYGCIEQRVTDGAKAADQAIRTNPYRAVGIAFGLGALTGFLLSRRSRE